MIIRPATLADLNECLLLDHAVATDHVWQMKLDDTESRVAVTFDTVRLPRQMQVEYPHDLQQLVEHWQLDEGFLAAEVDGEVRGYLDLIIRPWQRTGWIANMAVERGYRRRGIGTALMLEARKWARKQDLRSIQAEATTKNARCARSATVNAKGQVSEQLGAQPSTLCRICHAKEPQLVHTCRC